MPLTRRLDQLALLLGVPAQGREAFQASRLLLGRRRALGQRRCSRDERDGERQQHGQSADQRSSPWAFVGRYLARHFGLKGGHHRTLAMPEYDFRAPRLFVDAHLVTGAAVALDRDQSNYLGNVLRLKSGDDVLVFNGRDGEWQAAVGGRKRA